MWKWNNNRSPENLKVQGKDERERFVLAAVGRVVGVDVRPRFFPPSLLSGCTRREREREVIRDRQTLG